MKRASFTLFQPQRWMSLGQSALMVLFVWCCLGINTASAQEIKMPNADEATSTVKCADISTFTDDGGATGNYADSAVDADTISLCPDNAWSRVKVEFTSFDIEDNDSLRIFEGDYAAVTGTSPSLIGIAKGQGASSITLESDGSVTNWLEADCSLVTNKSGCLTFIFDTDGTNSKGAGWTANVTCSDRAAKFTQGNITMDALTCESISTTREASTEVSIPAPSISVCDADAGTEDAVTVAVTNQEGESCSLTTTTISKNTTDAFPESLDADFGPGSYKVVFTLVSDPTKKDSTTFTVQAPSLICNDNIQVPFGSACAVQLTPDDILENPCDTVTGVLEYDITIFLGEGKDADTLFTTTANGFPTITADDLDGAGMKVCNATAKVVITRKLTAGGDCDNGDQAASCTTTLSLDDQSKPFITLAANRIDTIVACNADSVGVILAGVATAIDNCKDDVQVVIESVVLDETDPCFGGNDTTFATVTFMAEDDCQNVMRVTDRVTIIRPSQIVKVGDLDPRNCDSDNNITEVPGLATGVIGADGEFEMTGTIRLDENKYVCGYRLVKTKDDVQIPGTDCGRKIYRYWSVLDWCNPEIGPSPVDTSFIEFTDTEAPFFVDTISFQVTEIDSIQLGPFDCNYDINEHIAPEADDVCGLKEVELHKVFRIEDGQDWPITDKEEWKKLNCDSFRLMYIARDLCHEQPLEDTTRQIVIIQDKTDPSAICTDELNVSVPNSDGARIHYTDIDAGSYDACGIKSIEIKRQDADDSAWGPTVVIGCSDVHNETVIEMRVTDNKDNVNTCWMTVIAEDKIAPICGNLPNLPLPGHEDDFTCDKFVKGQFGDDTEGKFLELPADLVDIYNLTFGNPFEKCSDNLDACATFSEEKQYYKVTELTCGALEIDRKWTVRDWTAPSGQISNEGTQHIDISYAPNWTLSFPKDEDLTCNQGFPLAAKADDIITNGSCDLWALEVSEKTFEVPGDICMKVERTYELINWCEFSTGDTAQPVDRNDDGSAVEISSANYSGVGRFTYVQVLKLYVNEAPDEPVITMNGDSCLFGEGDLEPFGMADVSITDGLFECEEERTFSAEAENCADIKLPSDNFSWKFYVNGQLEDQDTGSSFTKTVAPKTKYKVEFIVSDGCGNSSKSSQEYEFWDCKKPTPYVLHGLAIEMSQSGTIDLWASDLNQGSYDNCTVKNQLRYRLFKGDPIDGPQDIDAILDLDENVTFTCPIFGLQSVSFYVIDEEDRWDVVGTYVSVQTNNGACTDGQVGIVGGKITNATGENVELVNVSVNGGDNTMATGATGEFQFDLALEGDYTITPEKNISPLNGVSTYDLVLISKHILGLETFDSPYKYIAADVNQSGTITAFDMVQLRQLILNITSEFSNNTSWRFVDAKHEFTTQNPAGENFDEFMNINNLDGQMLDVDFIATKIGDVNGNAQANSLLGAESRTTNGTLNLNVTDRFVEAGQTVTVDFTSADIAATQGYQFTMDFAGLDLVELNEGVAKANNFNMSLAERGVLTTSWNGEATDENLFSITFTATTNGLLSELVSVNSDLTAAEAYNTAGELLDVAINFNANNVSAAFDLSQNTPNPFNGETLIGFNLPQAGTATLTVMDVQGKVLTVISQEGVKGYNQVTLNAKTLGATGVLYYQLESADNIATKKMIIID